MIIIIDYGMGNPGSILSMIRKLGGSATISSNPKDLESASAIILPGVGAFDNGMRKLRESGIFGQLNQRIKDDKIPFLGICLGMQLLFKNSEEGTLPGLDWIPGAVKRFSFSRADHPEKLRVPHMGWNVAQPTRTDSLFKGLSEELRFYFVHSYHVICDQKESILSQTEYGYPFVSAVQHENIFGVQFHPEKSHRFGMALMKNFLELSIC